MQPQQNGRWYGGDWNNTRYSQLEQLNTNSVTGLKAAWISSKFDEGGTSRLTPVVSGELMFVTGRGPRAARKNYGTGCRHRMVISQRRARIPHIDHGAARLRH